MILVVDLCYRKDSLSQEEFVRPIAKIAGNCIVKHHTELKENHIKSCEKIILCGTALKDNGYLEKIESFNWLKKTEKPILGICAGMQVIGLVFHAKLFEAKEIGMTRIKMLKENRLFSSDLNAYELHGHSISGLENFEVLAESDKCVQALKLRGREIYGIMFHPEVRQEKIIKNFVS